MTKKRNADAHADTGAGASAASTSSQQAYHIGGAKSSIIETMLSKLKQVESSGDANTWTALCPAHKDKRKSLSVTLADDGRILLKCFSGCTFEKIVTALGMTAAELAPAARPRAKLSLLEYSEAKKLPLSFLATLGLREVALGQKKGDRAVAIPYYNTKGEQIATRYRLAMTGDMRFRWRSGSKAALYGLQRLAKARERGYVLMVEGESDAQTAWLHDWPAIGLPGAGIFRVDWSAHFDGFERIYVADEKDQGTDAIRAWVAKSAIRDRVYFYRLDGCKDLSELHCADPEAFDAKLQQALDAAVPWTQIEQQRVAAVADEAWSACRHIATIGNILPAFSESLASIGVAGEVAAGQILYLCLTSRLLQHPVSVVVRGPSSGGKNYVLDRVLAHFPAEGFFELTGLSEHALIYLDANLRHRVLVIYEAEGAANEFTAYLLRGILSKGEIRYQTVVKTDEGMQPLTIVREGPISLAMTTTRPTLHPENETRLLSIPITDSKAQTSAVFHELARTCDAALAPAPGWIEFQTWLATQSNMVSVPFADALADLVPPAAIRLRRDFGAMLTLVRTHALLQQANRDRDAEGRIVADYNDYAAVAELLGPLISDAIGSTVPATILDTVHAVSDLNAIGGVTTAEVALTLDICRESARSRLATAATRGYVKNIETKKRQPARWVIADPLPADVPVLPSVDALIDHLASCIPTHASSANVDAQMSNAGLQSSLGGGIPTHTVPDRERVSGVSVCLYPPENQPATLHLSQDQPEEGQEAKTGCRHDAGLPTSTLVTGGDYVI